MYGDKPVDHPVGWLVVLGGFLLQFAVFGIMNSFTIFFHSMMADKTLGYSSQADLSLGSSISMGLSPLFGLFSGFLSDCLHPRILLLVAMGAVFMGLLTSAFFAETGLEVSLYFGIPISFAAGMMIVPATAATSTWFQRHQSTAIGIIFSGGGCGSFIIPLFCNPLLSRYGWRTTFYFLFLLVGFGVFGALLVERRSPPILEEITESDIEIPSTSTLFLEERTFRTARFGFLEVVRFLSTRTFLTSFLCQFLYTFCFFNVVYLPVPIALAMGKEGTVYHAAKSIEPDAAGRLMTWFGMAQAVGAVSSGLISAYLGCEAVFCLCSAVGCIGFCFFSFSTTYIELTIGVIVLALSASGMLSTYPSILAKIYYGANFGLIMSLVFLAGCVSGFAAPLSQLAISRVQDGDYAYGCVFAGGCTLAAGYVCYFFQWKGALEVKGLKSS